MHKRALLLIAGIFAGGVLTAVPLAAVSPDRTPPKPPTVAGLRQTANTQPTYRFASTDRQTPRARIRFRCAFDKPSLHPCASRYSERLQVGRHLLRVQAVDLAGNRSAIARVQVEVTPSLSVSGTIAFDNRGDIWLMNADGSEERRVTSGPADDQTAAWSPDGTRLAFSRKERDGSRDLFLMSADGSGVTRLTDAASDERKPRWSPDGRKIAFSVTNLSEEQEEQFSVWTMNADGSDRRMLHQEPAGFVSVSEWGPDAGTILLNIDRGGGGELDIYAIGTDGSGLRQLTSARGDDTEANVAPDGTAILFRSDGLGGISVMGPDGSEPRLILKDRWGLDLARGVWSPDGKHVVWTGKPYRGPAAPIYVMQANGTRVTQIHEPLSQGANVDWRP